MADELPPYPEYKGSRLPWLGKIPAHWEEKRAKFYLREVDERTQTGAEELLSVSHLTGVTSRSQKNVTMFKAESYVGHKLCRPGDIVVNTMWAWMAALGVSRQVGIVSPSYAVYRFRSPGFFLPEFVDHLLRTAPYGAEYVCRSTGIRASRLRLYPDKFLDIPVVRPPLAEQETAVAFLRYTDHDIRRFIRNKRRTIALLNEQKQAIINQAVTRGVEPSVHLKPSGVEWLDDVPAHWGVRALKQMAAIRLSGVDKVSAQGEIPVRLCNYVDVYKRDFITQDLEFMPGTATLGEVAAFTLRAGDVLITKDSESWQDIAVPALVREDLDGVLCGYHVALLRPDQKVLHSEYLFRAFSAPALLHQFRVAANGVTRHGLSKHAIKSALFPVPPVEEQERICCWIEEQLGPIRISTEGAQRDIALISEYRASLIADVVAGQVDVRHVATQTAGPGPEELEPVDESYTTADNGELTADEVERSDEGTGEDD